MNKTKGGKDFEQTADEAKAHELTNRLARALKRIEYHDESECAALLPLSMKIAKLYEPWSRKPSSGTPILKTMT